MILTEVDDKSPCRNKNGKCIFSIKDCQNIKKCYEKRIKEIVDNALSYLASSLHAIHSNKQIHYC